MKAPGTCWSRSRSSCRSGSTRAAREAVQAFGVATSGEDSRRACSTRRGGSRARRGRQGLRHLGRRRAGRDAPADPAPVRPPRPGHARPPTGRRPAVLVARRRTAARGAATLRTRASTWPASSASSAGGGARRAEATGRVPARVRRPRSSHLHGDPTGERRGQPPRAQSPPDVHPTVPPSSSGAEHPLTGDARTPWGWPPRARTSLRPHLSTHHLRRPGARDVRT